MSPSDFAAASPERRGLRRSVKRIVVETMHFAGYYALLKRPGTRKIKIAGFDLTIGPTVYDPRYYRAPEYFAEFIGGLDLSGKSVADLGTGSGLQALAAARAGASNVLALDVNPNAVAAAALNARANGLEDRVSAVVSNLFSVVAPGPQFDVILTNPPFCDGPAWDVADRAWRAGRNYEDIAPLFAQARERLLPNGVVYLIMSSHTDLAAVGHMVQRAGFTTRIAAKRRVLLETLIIFDLRPA
jgi:release factor glutamine methyltransferase